MTHFIWFDNDNLDYGGIGVIEYGNTVSRILHRPKDSVAENDNPPPPLLAIELDPLTG